MCVQLRHCPLLLFLLLPLGCGKAYQVAPVSGRVMMDNRPLAHAEVRFYPIAGQDLPYSTDVTDDQGNYKLHLGTDDNTKGAVVGEHRVTISVDQRKTKIASMPGARVPSRRGELVPGRYNRDSKLTCTVPAEGKKDAQFALRTK
jgi:hypothetical protein